MIRFILLTGFLLLSGCQEKSPTEPDQRGYQIDQATLNAAFNSLESLPGMRALVVSLEGEIVGERFYNGTGPDADPAFDVRSVTKSITSTLVGIALQEGFLTSLDQTLDNVIGRAVELDSVKAKITVRQLITMTAGFDWKEIVEPSEFSQWVAAPDQINYILERPMRYTPGTVFDYSDGAAHLASVVLTHATGMSTTSFAHQYLFTPLEIGDRNWISDNRGYQYGGVGVGLGPYDLIKIGSLYLGKGIYKGERIVSEEWITSSTTPQVTTNNALPQFPSYGYYWWIGNRNGRSYYAAVGYGGQFIVVSPDVRLVVAATCSFKGLGNLANTNWNSIITTILNSILPAVQSP